MRLKSNPPTTKNSKKTSLKSQALRTENVSYSNRFLVNLEELQYYPNIMHLDLSDNLISDHNAFKLILNPYCMKTVVVKGNPICEQINYAYPFLFIFPNLQKIDTIQFQSQQDKQQLIKCQNQLGDLLVKLLYLKSQSGFSNLFQSNNIDIQSMHQSSMNMQYMLKRLDQIQQALMKSFQIIRIQFRSQFYFKNFTMEKVLSTIVNNNQSNLFIPQQYIERIRSYWLEQLLNFSANSLAQDSLITFLLDKIRICPQKLIQEQFISDPNNCKHYIESLLFQRYKQNHQTQSRIKQPKKKTQISQHKQKPNFLSVQTNDTCCINIYKNMFHFCLDQKYMNTSFQVLELHLVDFMEKIGCLKKQINGAKQINNAKLMAEDINRRKYRGQRNSMLQLTFQPSVCNSIWNTFLTNPNKQSKQQRHHISTLERQFEYKTIQQQSTVNNCLDAYQIRSNSDIPLQICKPKHKKKENSQQKSVYCHLNCLLQSESKEEANLYTQQLQNSALWQDKFVIQRLMKSLSKYIIKVSFHSIKNFVNIKTKLQINKGFKKLDNQLYEIKRHCWIKIILFAFQNYKENQCFSRRPQIKYKCETKDISLIQELNRKRQNLLTRILEKKSQVQQKQVKIAVGRWKRFTIISKIKQIAGKQIDSSVKSKKNNSHISLQYSKITKKYNLK